MALYNRLGHSRRTPGMAKCSPELGGDFLSCPEHQKQGLIISICVAKLRKTSPHPTPGHGASLQRVL